MNEFFGALWHFIIDDYNTHTHQGKLHTPPFWTTVDATGAHHLCSLTMSVVTPIGYTDYNGSNKILIVY